MTSPFAGLGALPPAAEKPKREAGAHRRMLEPAEPNPWGLSAAQCGVIKLLVQGLTHTEAAFELGISAKTLTSHLERVKLKMNAETNIRAAVLWDRHFRAKEAACQ